MTDLVSKRPTGATPSATASYARGFDRAATGYFRQAFGLTVSSIGLGTYLGRDDEADDGAYYQAIVAAVQGGINMLDSAASYRSGRSERAVGAALRELGRLGFARDHLVLASKAGYVPGPTPREYFVREIVGRGLAVEEDLEEDCHCIAPGFLRHQLECSLESLGVESIDLYYLHNPEEQTGLETRLFVERMRRAFETLEDLARAGRVGVYGTSTWEGYRAPAHTQGWLSLERLVRLAEEVGGADHHFRVVQAPFNLAMTEALAYPNQTLREATLPLLACAERLGVTVVTSAPLLQGRLLRRMPEAFRAALETLPANAQKAVQFARSAPGVTTTLVGMRTLSHVQEALGLVSVDPLPTDTVERLLRSLSSTIDG
jgi:aryl-alcohol dehydrogenase-like predicted oxidoreductase